MALSGFGLLLLGFVQKLALIGHLPFFVISLLLASAKRLPRREMALVVFALVGLSLPWYIRNLSEAHDPTPPMFNLLFDHPDPIFTQTDAAWIYLTGRAMKKWVRRIEPLFLRFRRRDVRQQSRLFAVWNQSGGE